MSSLQEKKAWLGWHAGRFLEYSFTSSHSIFHITHRSPGNLQVLSVTIHEHSVNSDGSLLVGKSPAYCWHRLLGSSNCTR